VDLLSDLVAAPKFDPDELVKERDVIIEEINQSEDHPDDLASELFYQKFWEGGPLGHPILGRPEQVRHYTAENVRDFFFKTYRPKNLLIVAAGDIDGNEFVSLVESKLEGRLNHGIQDSPTEQKPNHCCPFIYNMQRRGLNQTSLVIGFSAPCHRHVDRVAASILCHILGGGMSSRLFFELREKRALCYQIGSFTTNYCDSGALQIVASCASNKARELVRCTMDECRRLADDGPSQAELDRTKLQLRTSLVFSQESTGSRMFSIAHQAMYMDSIMDMDQQLTEIDAIALEHVCRVAKKILIPKMVGISALGAKKAFEIRLCDL
jgi:predicted Zn-dependent peptidase